MTSARDPSASASPSGKLGAQRVFIDGVPFDNTAAKFWTTLIDELLVEYEGVDTVVLEGATGGLLVSDFLTPEAALQRDMDHLSRAEGSARQTLEEVIAAMEIIGPPASVQMTVRAGDSILVSRDMRAEALDADILPFLIVWMLEWGVVGEWAWNQEKVTGRFMADDRERKWVYLIHFTMTHRHLSEGLFHRAIEVRFKRDPRLET